MEQRIADISISLKDLNMTTNEENILKLKGQKTKPLVVNFSVNTPILSINDEKLPEIADGNQIVNTSGKFILKVLDDDSVLFSCEGQNIIRATIFLEETEENLEKVNLILKSTYNTYVIGEVKSLMARTDFPFPKIEIQI